LKMGVKQIFAKHLFSLNNAGISSVLLR